ncbi:hypothetical protein OIU78_012597 [Salix suchowensis]|nr:hypothetical protein OIU78_012597 [Salix suchowensis]
MERVHLSRDGDILLPTFQMEEHRAVAVASSCLEDSEMEEGKKAQSFVLSYRHVRLVIGKSSCAQLVQLAASLCPPLIARSKDFVGQM